MRRSHHAGLITMATLPVGYLLYIQFLAAWHAVIVSVLTAILVFILLARHAGYGRVRK